MISWTEKHRPSCFVDVKGQEVAIEKIKKFILEFPQKKKAMILYGPPGTGKTTLAHVSAKENDSEIFELNASDFRNKENLDEKLKPALEQMSLNKKTKIILVDEADGISGYYDKGGIPELVRLIEDAKFPIIITANDVWNKKLAPVRSKSEMVELKEIDYNTIKETLSCVLKKENILIHPTILTEIAIKSKGDLRAAINDLQSASKLEDYSKIIFDERNTEINIFNALKQIFKTKPSNELLNVFDSVKMPIDDIILWVEENIPTEYQGKELARAYDLLSKVDLFKGRIYKQQYWRFLVYENIFLSYGISASKKTPKIGFTSYKKPTRILKIWMNNQKTAKKISIAKKYASHVHIGEKRANQEFGILKQIILSNPKIQQELKLDEEEMEYLRR